MNKLVQINKNMRREFMLQGMIGVVFYRKYLQKTEFFCIALDGVD